MTFHIIACGTGSACVAPLNYQENQIIQDTGRRYGGYDIRCTWTELKVVKSNVFKLVIGILRINKTNPQVCPVLTKHCKCHCQDGRFSIIVEMKIDHLDNGTYSV